MVVPTDSRTQARRVRLLHMTVAKQKIACGPVNVMGPRSARLVHCSHVPTGRRGSYAGGSYIAVAGQDFARMSRTGVLSQKVTYSVVAISGMNQPARRFRPGDGGNWRRCNYPGGGLRRIAQNPGRAQLVGQGEELKPQIRVKDMTPGALRLLLHPGEHISVIVAPLQESPPNLAQVVNAHNAITPSTRICQQGEAYDDK